MLHIQQRTKENIEEMMRLKTVVSLFFSKKIYPLTIKKYFSFTSYFTFTANKFQTVWIHQEENF